MTDLQHEMRAVLRRFDERFFDSLKDFKHIDPWYINDRMETAALPIARHISKELQRRKKHHEA